MTPTVATYLVYIAISVALTITVGQVLSRHGLVFLGDVFARDDSGEAPGMGRAVNTLLLVGFYLVNFGYVALALRVGRDVPDVRRAIEVLSTKLGGVALFVGVVHMVNFLVLSSVRRRRVAPGFVPPPAPGVMAPPAPGIVAPPAPGVGPPR